ncbi:MAG TPA: hypothetical protein DF296_14410 [Candidatus Margulisbacteria bacterium]|nr:MAG: hypothetical protein A2X43_13980 [Candidatus Margulisbacteria bacterium GWD2_39_127]OGI02281.1 MAG: hypothetical protein A2X42_13045 [Candidatus Margulisbacteria bacterium GWF2_38_17]OGI11531.1 MAG: hypothetical protein A2X41_02690 [Candidatus Margulisbacteria bacterium GWE2_39_32]HAR63751.1 hypothetical protein [Candidatus Margulisiibacteriota bacterium]HCT86380.1 hypothetical protein [Candidatus Margulisiibacteriota bacterium]
MFIKKLLSYFSQFLSSSNKSMQNSDGNQKPQEILRIKKALCYRINDAQKNYLGEYKFDTKHKIDDVLSCYKVNEKDKIIEELKDQASLNIDFINTKEEMLERLQADNYAVVLFPYKIKDENPLEVLKSIRNKNASVKTILIVNKKIKREEMITFLRYKLNEFTHLSLSDADLFFYYLSDFLDDSCNS